MVSTRDKVLHGKFHKFVTYIIFFSMISGSLLVLIPQIFNRWFEQRPMNAIATINGRDIDLREYRFRLAQEYEQIALIKKQYGDYADNVINLFGLDNPKKHALNSLFYESLLDQLAIRLGLSISNEYLEHKLKDPSFVMRELRDIVPFEVLNPQTGTLDQNRLRYYLKARRITFADFENVLKQSLARKFAVDLIASSVYVSPDMVSREYDTMYRKRSYGIAQLPFEYYVQEAKKQNISDEEARAYFIQQNKASKRYWTPEQRSGTAWIFVPEQFGIAINDKEIEREYSRNKREYIESPAQVNIARILLRVDDKTTPEAIMEKAKTLQKELSKDPSLFEQKAKEFSQDTQTAKKGGVLGFIKRGNVDSNLEKAAFRLKNDDDISEIIRTKDGLEIIKRLGRKNSTYKPLANVRSDIERKMTQKRFAAQFIRKADKITKEAKNSDNAQIQAFIAEHNGKKTEVPLHPIDETTLRKNLFKIKAGRWGAFMNEDGTGIILNTTNVQKTQEPSFESVKKQVIQDLYTQKAHELIDAKVDAINRDLEAGKSLSSLANNSGVIYKETEMINQEDTVNLENLEKQGINRNTLLSITYPKQHVSLLNGNGFVVSVIKQEPIDQKLFEEKKASIMQRLYQEQRNIMVQGFIASLCRNAKIKHYAVDEHSNPMAQYNFPE